jgi:hypothetical protein
VRDVGRAVYPPTTSRPDDAPLTPPVTSRSFRGLVLDEEEAHQVAPTDSRLTDEQVADELDALARHVNRLRHLMPSMTIAQLAAIDEAMPFPAGTADALLDLDTWAICAAASLRDLVIDLAG